MNEAYYYFMGWSLLAINNAIWSLGNRNEMIYASYTLIMGLIGLYFLGGKTNDIRN